MRPIAFTLLACVSLAACGGGDRMARNYGGNLSTQSVSRAAPIGFASGPISQACHRSERRAANSRLCGCIQNAANGALSGADQRRAAAFFADPHAAQEMRQSDNAGHEAFWLRYKAFAASAEAQCKGL